MNNNLVILLVLALGFFGGRMVCPRTEPSRVIPRIVTQYDTVHTLQRDTIWRTRTVRHYTTDTFNLVIRETIYDTVVVSPSSRLWPIVSYTMRHRDTARVRTYDPITGHGAAVEVWTPGPLHEIQADTTPTPRMTFGTYPNTKTSGGTKLLYLLGGYALCSAATWANGQLRSESPTPTLRGLRVPLPR